MVEYWECNDTASVGASYCNWAIMIFPGVIRSGIGMVSSTKNYIDSFLAVQNSSIGDLVTHSLTVL